jgi:hypothetical protein
MTQTKLLTAREHEILSWFTTMRNDLDELQLTLRSIEQKLPDYLYSSGWLNYQLNSLRTALYDAHGFAESIVDLLIEEYHTP